MTDSTVAAVEAAFVKIAKRARALQDDLLAAKRNYAEIIGRAAVGDVVTAAEWRRAEDKITDLARQGLRIRLILQQQERLVTSANAELARALAQQLAKALLVVAPAAGNA